MDEMTNKNSREIAECNVQSCARCGKDHERLEFKPFFNSDIVVGNYECFTHWALCPTYGEPILMRIV